VRDELHVSACSRSPSAIRSRRGPGRCACASELPTDDHAGEHICVRRRVLFSFAITCLRMIVGWQLASHMRTDLVLDALRMALGLREHGADVQLVATRMPARNTSLRTTPRS